ncbi:MAG: helix-turn-helix domain-containing protein [Bacteroidetes bacterium]|nr:helix-turn-helix domain-containing protein [Bacteroidota bacterium]
MKIITIESEAFRQIMEAIENIRKVNEDNLRKAMMPFTEQWVDNEYACKLLNVSKRTLQTYRDERMLPYSQIHAKIYYRVADLERFLKRHYVRHSNTKE